MKTSNFTKIYQDLLEDGFDSVPRGQLTRELLNYTYVLRPFERFAAYPSRKLNLDYIRQELQWYLHGDRADLSICDHAKIWQGCVQGGLIQSNYGYYLFRQKELEYAVKVLKLDKNTRRAVMPILNASHLNLESHDVPCTISIGLRIVENLLRCTVHMRSQDAIYGLGNDVPFFSIVQELALQLLRDSYPALVMGELSVFVESLHVYERHFEMLEKLVAEVPNEIVMPRITDAQEAWALLNRRPDGYKAFGRWLYAV